MVIWKFHEVNKQLLQQRLKPFVGRVILRALICCYICPKTDYEGIKWMNLTLCFVMKTKDDLILQTVNYVRICVLICLYLWLFVENSQLFTSSIITVNCTITNSIITSSNRTFDKNRHLNMNNFVNIGATVLRIWFAGCICITVCHILRNLLTKPVKTRLVFFLFCFV